MLLSPGHSPRNLSTPEPVREQTPNADDNLNRSSAAALDGGRKRPRNSPKVLDEDSYVEAIDKIIERDYFPDIPKLRDRLDWLQATRTRDPVLIRDVQLKILERRRRLNRGGSTATSATPGTSSLFRNSSVTPSLFRNSSVTPSLYGIGLNKDGEQVGDAGGGDEREVEVDVESLSLDEFLRKYTSEDNESFSRIIEKVNRKKREKYAFLLEAGSGNDNSLLIENGESSKREAVPTDGYGTSNQPTSTLLGWKYTPKNSLMYHPSDGGELPLTDEEKALRLKAQTKEISKPNTRFHGKAKDPDAMLADDDDGSGAAVLYTTIAGATPIPMPRRDGDKVKKYDLEDLKKTPNRFYVDSDKKAENGYSFVRTPSPAPGLDESPFITWGEIEGTPLRLEPEDTPLDIGGSGDGPAFKIQMPPSRDVKAHSLSREAARKLRERSKMFQKPPLPSPMRGGSATPARILSPAAQKFMRNAIAKSSRSIDESLRASYRSASPGYGTPKSGRSISRLGRDGSPGGRSPSVTDGSNAPW